MQGITTSITAMTVKLAAISDLSTGQLDLFAEFLAGVVASPLARAKFVRRRRPKRKPQVQLFIEFREPDEIPDEYDFPEHRVVKATECKAPATRAYRSVWDLGSAPAESRPSLRMSRPGVETTREILRRIVREADHTRHIAVREQETDEWREKEERRRARQRPPKPPKQAFRMKNSRQFHDAGEK